MTAAVHPIDRVRPTGARRAASWSPSNLPEAFRYFISRGSPRLLIAASAITVGLRIAIGNWSAWDLVPATALVLYWPIQEWLIHVYVLHFKPFTWRGRRVDFAVPRKHRQHHRDPNNLDILFIPMHSYLYTVPFLVVFWFAVTPSTQLALTGLSLHFLFSLNYEWVHFLVHTRVVPRTDAYRRLWKSHRLHHFKNEHYWMGVSRLGADWLLHTTPDPQSVATSPTCRDLIGAGKGEPPL
jgi:hypothetical protein